MKKIYFYAYLTLNCVDFLGDDPDLCHYLYYGAKKVDFQAGS